VPKWPEFGMKAVYRIA